MSKPILTYSQKNLKESLYDTRFYLEKELETETDPTVREDLKTMRDACTREIRRIIDEEIKKFTDEMKNDPAVQADVTFITEKRKEAEKKAKLVKNATDKVQAAANVLAPAAEAIDKLVGFFV